MQLKPSMFHPVCVFWGGGRHLHHHVAHLTSSALLSMPTAVLHWPAATVWSDVGEWVGMHRRNGVGHPLCCCQWQPVC